MPNRDNPVPVRLTDSEKEKWETYVEENDDVESLSHLIRRSVVRELARDGETPNAGVAVEGRSEINSTVDSLKRELSDLQMKVRKTKMMAERNPRDVEAKNALIQMLGAGPSPPEWVEDQDEIPPEVTTPADAADDFNRDYTPDEVYDLLDELEDEVTAVEKAKVRSTGEDAADYGFYQYNDV